jgi:hypothetical protein
MARYLLHPNYESAFTHQEAGATVITENDNNRHTYMPLREILSAAAKYCLTAAAKLDALSLEAPKTASLAWEEMASQEHELAKLIEDFACRGPVNLLDTQFQYTQVHALPGEPESVEEAVAQLVNFNHELTESLDQLALEVAPVELSEAMDELCREVTSIARRISMISTTMRDV